MYVTQVNFVVPQVDSVWNDGDAFKKPCWCQMIGPDWVRINLSLYYENVLIYFFFTVTAAFLIRLGQKFAILSVF